MGLVIDEEHFSRLLERLKLNGIRCRLDAVLEEAAKEGWSYREVLYRLCCVEGNWSVSRAEFPKNHLEVSGKRF